jgi:acyl carrier protein
MHERVKLVIGSILDLDPNSIGESTRAENTPTWDSMNHIKMIVALEDEFNVIFEVEEIQSLVSYHAITGALELRGV